jgi:hypothetical protein
MPSIDWWREYAKSNKIATFFYYQKQTYLNRAEIKGPHRIERITIPVVHRDKKLPYRDVEIIYDENLKRKIIQTLRCAYGKTAYFPFYFDELHSIVTFNYKYLHQLNDAMISWLARSFHLPSPVYVNSSFDDIKIYFKKIRQKVSYTYYQPFGEFVPNLSGIDLLMNCGSDGKLILQSS